MSYTVLIADDNVTVRRSIRSLLEFSTEWKICGEAENGAEAVEKALDLRPDVVILDLGMPVINGLEAARRISQLVPGSAMLMFTMHANEHLARVADSVGIRRVISKADGAENLITAIADVLAADPPLRPKANSRASSNRLRPIGASDSAHPHRDQ